MRCPCLLEECMCVFHLGNIFLGQYQLEDVSWDDQTLDQLTRGCVKDSWEPFIRGVFESTLKSLACFVCIRTIWKRVFIRHILTFASKKEVLEAVLWLWVYLFVLFCTSLEIHLYAITWVMMLTPFKTFRTLISQNAALIASTFAAGKHKLSSLDQGSPQFGLSAL